jgi:hypothetical protein
MLISSSFRRDLDVIAFAALENVVAECPETWPEVYLFHGA